MIPKVIHYCWFGGNPLSEKELKCIHSWEKYCPGYVIKRWDESNFDLECNDYVKEAYANKKWAFVSDYARLFILYHEGGLYFDTDVELIKPIDDIVVWGPFMGFESRHAVNPGLGIGAEKEMPLYKELLDHYDHIHFIGPDGMQNPGTIVSITTNALVKRGLKRISKNQRVEGIVIYKEEYFSPIDFQTGILKTTANTRSIHHYRSSWFSPAEKKLQKLQERLVRVFGRRLGMSLGQMLSSTYKALVRVKKNGIKKTVRYYIRLIKWRKTESGNN